MTGARAPRVCTIGDAVLDVIIELTRLPVADDDVPARIALTGGGQAANVAAWCAVLGAQASVITLLGDDLTGSLVRSMLGRLGVEVLGPVVAGATGAIASIVTPDGKRSMASDRGTSQGLRADQIDPQWFEGCEWLHISGYSLFGGDGEAPLAAAAFARAQGAQVSVDLSAATVVESLGADEARRRVQATGSSVLFANEAELAALGPIDVPTVVVKRGASGCRVLEGSVSRELPAAEDAVVRDTTGAGDAFAAGWIVGGADLALLAARDCIALRGGAPLVEDVLASKLADGAEACRRPAPLRT